MRTEEERKKESEEAEKQIEENKVKWQMLKNGDYNNYYENSSQNAESSDEQANQKTGNDDKTDSYLKEVLEKSKDNLPPKKQHMSEKEFCDYVYDSAPVVSFISDWTGRFAFFLGEPLVYGIPFVSGIILSANEGKKIVDKQLKPIYDNYMKVAAENNNRCGVNVIVQQIYNNNFTTRSINITVVISFYYAANNQYLGKIQ